METFPTSHVGVEGFTSQEDQEMISRIEKQLKRRFAIGSQVSEHSIVQDFTKQVSVAEHHSVGSVGSVSFSCSDFSVLSRVSLFQKYAEHAIYKVLHLMLRRGELQHRMQKKVLYRVK